MLSGAPRSRDHCQNPRRGVETSRRCLPSKYRSREFWPRNCPGHVSGRETVSPKQGRENSLKLHLLLHHSSFSGSFDSALETVREATVLPGAPLKMTGAGGFASPQQHRILGASLVPFAACRAVLHDSSTSGHLVCGLMISLSRSCWLSTRTRWGYCSPP
jgi:hypothetical protein